MLPSNPIYGAVRRVQIKGRSRTIDRWLKVGAMRRVSGGAHVGGLQPFWSLGRLKLHRFALVERTVSVLLNRRVMDEDVSASVRLREKPEALFCIKPFDCTGRHCGCPLFTAGRNGQLRSRLHAHQT